MTPCASLAVASFQMFRFDLVIRARQGFGSSCVCVAAAAALVARTVNVACATAAAPVRPAALVARTVNVACATAAPPVRRTHFAIWLVSQMHTTTTRRSDTFSSSRTTTIKKKPVSRNPVFKNDFLVFRNICYPPLGRGPKEKTIRLRFRFRFRLFRFRLSPEIGGTKP